ncbi:MAG: hypothetical protein V5786_04785 [Psychromonas sp.]
MHKLILLMSFCLATSSLWAAEDPEVNKTKSANTGIFDKPLIERYVLDELKALRHDFQNLERDLTIEMTERELNVADRSLSYASNTVTYFFYIIAGVASLVAMIGWQSLREIRENTTKTANQQIKEISNRYEEKFQVLESDLRRKTRRIADNHIEIEKINEIHNLWLRAQKAQTPNQKIEAYDEILKVRTGDLEALTSKADAVMEMREFHWALSICNRVLEVDDNNQNALYQRACAFSCLGAEEQAIYDLTSAIAGHAALKELAADEADFENLKGNEQFEKLISKEQT